MRTTGKRLLCYTSRKSSLLKRDIQSKLNSAPRRKNGKISNGKISYTKRCKLKLRSHMKSTGSRKNIINSKTGKTLGKVSDFNSTKRQSFFKHRHKTHSCLSREEDEKIVNGDGEIRRKTNRRKRKRKRRNIVQDEASRLQRRTRYLLIKMKLEHNLIDAYSGDGWKGQSREKIKPEKELQRAKKQILVCKLGIRDAIHQLDLLSSEGCIENSVIHPDGSVFHEHIFCAKCKSSKAFPDNDIILCDGACNCGFHQKCLEPPLTKIPPGDQGWLCKFCECKTEILEAMNAHLGTCFSVNCSWEDIFVEAATAPNDESTYLDPAQEWPSEDSEDDDYDPEINEISDRRTSLDETISDIATSSSMSPGSSNVVTSTSISFHEDQDGGSSKVKTKRKDKSNFVNSIISVDSDDTRDREMKSYRRQRRDVDYKKLHDEMFGKDLVENEQQSEDEDWGPRRRKRRMEYDSLTTTANCANDDNRSLKMGLYNGVKKELPPNLRDRKCIFRIPHNAVEKLRQVFAENELPSRSVKENLSKQLGLAPEKVSKWFKNARYAALKVRKLQAESSKSHSNNINKRSSSNMATNQCSNGVTTKDNTYLQPSTPGVHVPKNLKRILRRKNPKSMAISHKKQHRIVARALPKDRIEVNSWFGNAECFTKHMTGMRKFPSKKIGDTKEERASLHGGEINDSEHLYLVEMERLCSLQDRLEKMKKTLQECRDEDDTSIETHSSKQLVMYVPVAVVMEKDVPSC